MSYSTLLSPTFFAFLLEIDRDLAEGVRLLGCIACGGPLHQGHYQRKPRGYGCGARSPMDTIRFSFCCGTCRGREKPVSVRFLGRRVYWGVMVVLATALCAGLNLRRGQELSEQIGVPVRTIERWRQWWLNQFTTSAVWLALRGRFLPPVGAADLPGELLRRTVATDEYGAMVTVLRWLAPLSALAKGR